MQDGSINWSRILRDSLFHVIIVGTLVTVAAFFATRPEYANDQNGYAYDAGKDSNKETKEKFIGVSAEGWTAIFTGVLSVFTFVLAGVSVIQIKFLTRADKIARESVEVAREALVAANRPWVTVRVEMNGPLSYDPRGAYFPFKFTLENVGNSPAKNVFIRASVVCQEYDGVNVILPQDTQRQIITEMKKGKYFLSGNTVFPRIRSIQNLGVYMPWNKVDIEKRTTGYMLPSLVGVVVYVSEFSDTRHVTGFIFDIARDPSRRSAGYSDNGRIPSVIYPDEKDVPQEDILLHQSQIIGGSYAD